MENTAPLLNVNAKAQLGNFAALPGTGPLGQVCSHCALLEAAGSKFTCGKFQKMTGRKGKPISPNSAACRYFALRPAFNTPKV